MKYRKRTSRRESQTLNTSSLPDIVFMILFFFMAVGMFPPPQPLIENDIVVAEGIELDDTSNYIHLRVSKSEIQLGYDIIQFEDLTELLIKIEDKNVVILHIDNDTPIGYIKNHIEKAIFEAGKTRIAYEVIQEEV